MPASLPSAVRLALAQVNPLVGAINANAAIVEKYILQAHAAGAHLLVFPELMLCGYPPKDLLIQEGFVAAAADAAEHLGASVPADLTVVLGLPLPADEGITNSLLAFRGGRRLARYDKRLLPTYDVFDEDRYFLRGDAPTVIDVHGVPCGLSICEDLWKGEDVGFKGRYRYAPDPVRALVDAGASLIINPSASPFVLGKGARHRALLRHHAQTHNVWVAAVNQVGGNDELIFDGHACVFDPTGKLVAAAPGFSEEMLIADLTPTPLPVDDPLLSTTPEAQIFLALRLGLADYCRKTGFRSALLGVSGGIDSAVVAAIAVVALGPDNVLGVAMPGPYSSPGSLNDAIDLTRRLGTRLVTIPIESMLDAARHVIDPAFAYLDASPLGAALPDIAEENIQSRLRGVITMTLSNRTGSLVLTTGNKSELSVGYCTLYGDMNGGLAVISDLTKGQVYALARWLNDNHRECGLPCPPIPESTITKPPSAELAPGQRDQDTLPPYDQLDDIVRRYIETHQSPAGIARDTGYPRPLVDRICRMIDRNEYKRKQLTTGLKISSVAFGVGRRMPIARGWYEYPP